MMHDNVNLGYPDLVAFALSMPRGEFNRESEIDFFSLVTPPRPNHHPYSNVFCVTRKRSNYIYIIGRQSLDTV